MPSGAKDGRAITYDQDAGSDPPYDVKENVSTECHLPTVFCWYRERCHTTSTINRLWRVRVEGRGAWRSFLERVHDAFSAHLPSRCPRFSQFWSPAEASFRRDWLVPVRRLSSLFSFLIQHIAPSSHFPCIAHLFSICCCAALPLTRLREMVPA
jgi:hypothetical protein